MTTSPLRLALIGCGGFAGAHCRRLRERDDVRIVALADQRAEQIDSLIGRRLAEYSPEPAHYTDCAELFATEQLDAVMIVTPHSTHRELVEQALAADCHVLVEKPIAVTTAEAQRMLTLASERQRLLLTCYNPPFLPVMQRLRELIVEQPYGPLRLVSASINQDWARMTDNSWRQTHDQGPGQIGDSGAHLLAGVMWAVGRPVQEVSSFFHNRGRPVPIDGVANLRFDGEVLASLAIGGSGRTESSIATFVFDSGLVEVDVWLGKWYRLRDADGALIDEYSTAAEPDPDAHFIACLKGEAEPVIDPGLAVHITAVTEALTIAAANGGLARPVV